MVRVKTLSKNKKRRKLLFFTTIFSIEYSIYYIAYNEQ